MKGHAVILLASSSCDRLRSWTQGLEGVFAATAVSDLDALMAEMVRTKPDVLMLDLDLPDLDGAKGAARLIKLNPATKVVALGGEPCDVRELALFRLGVRGCCRNDIDPQLLKSVVIAIKQGELWIRRSLTPRLLDELGARIRADNDGRRATLTRLAELTRREREIAERIGNGDTNKQIARKLAITESTVKAHLTEVFRKLGIADRLKLALLVADTSDI
jgi:two-component system NarL family response regulator